MNVYECNVYVQFNEANENILQTRLDLVTSHFLTACPE